MKTFQFTCAVRVQAPDTPWDGDIYVIPGLITPPIKSESRGEALMQLMREHPVIDWTSDVDPNAGTEYVVYEVVRS